MKTLWLQSTKMYEQTGLIEQGLASLYSSQDAHQTNQSSNSYAVFICLYTDCGRSVFPGGF